MAYKKTIGYFLLTVLLLSGIVYISMDSVRLRVDNDKSTFYIKNLDNDGNVYGRWLVSGREYNKFYDGSSLIRRHAKDINISTIVNNTNNLTIIKRFTPYFNGANIIDTYLFNGSTKDVELFPVTHTIEIYNGNTCGDNGCIFQYEVRDLDYNGSTRKAVSPESFGMRMNVEWQEGAYYSKIFKQVKSNKLIVKYRVKSDYVKINTRLFDPIIFENDTSTLNYTYTFLNKTIDIIKYHNVNESYQVPIYKNVTQEVSCNPLNETCFSCTIYNETNTDCKNWTHEVYNGSIMSWHIINKSYTMQEQVPDERFNKVTGIYIDGNYTKSQYIGGLSFYNDCLCVANVPPGERNWEEFPCRDFELEKGTYNLTCYGEGQ